MYLFVFGGHNPTFLLSKYISVNRVKGLNCSHSILRNHLNQLDQTVPHILPIVHITLLPVRRKRILFYVLLALCLQVMC